MSRCRKAGRMDGARARENVTIVTRGTSGTDCAALHIALSYGYDVKVKLPACHSLSDSVRAVRGGRWQLALEDLADFYPISLSPPWGADPIVLNDAMLKECFEVCCCKPRCRLRRKNPSHETLANLFLQTNQAVVKNVDVLYAFENLCDGMEKVEGATGRAVQMALGMHKEVFVFDTYRQRWYQYEQRSCLFMPCRDCPTLCSNSAVLGTCGVRRDQELHRLFERTFVQRTWDELRDSFSPHVTLFKSFAAVSTDAQIDAIQSTPNRST